MSQPLRGSASGDYYLKAAQQEYYTKSLGPPGQWFGRGATELGLQGKVEASALRNLLEGKSPDGAQRLVQDQKWKERERQSGWDMTFSAPKSVSVLWSQSSSEARSKIESAHRVAVEKALAFLEREAGITRRGAGGKVRENAKLIFSLFQHGTSRAGDPQLHTHALLFNVSIREDGTAGAVWSKAFFDTKMAAGAVYQLELTKQLRQEMNLSITLDQKHFRVEGVPTELCKIFSKRRQLIKKVLEQEGDQSPKNAERIAILTRPSKQEMPANQLFAEWQKVGEAHGWGVEQARKLVQDAEKSKSKPKSASQLKREQEDKAEAAEQRMIAMLNQAEDKNAKQNSFERKDKPEEKQPYFRFERRLLFPRAPDWSPFKALRIPILISGEKKPKDWWGKVRWKMDTPFGQLQWRSKLLFPHAPEWNPLKHLAVRRLVLGQKTEWKWRKIVWKKNTAIGQLQRRQKALFPGAKQGSFAHKLSLPAFRLQIKRPDYKNSNVNQPKHTH